MGKWGHRPARKHKRWSRGRIKERPPRAAVRGALLLGRKESPLRVNASSARARCISLQGAEVKSGSHKPPELMCKRCVSRDALTSPAGDEKTIASPDFFCARNFQQALFGPFGKEVRERELLQTESSTDKSFPCYCTWQPPTDRLPEGSSKLAPPKHYSSHSRLCRPKRDSPPPESRGLQAFKQSKRGPDKEMPECLMYTAFT